MADNKADKAEKPEPLSPEQCLGILQAVGNQDHGTELMGALIIKMHQQRHSDKAGIFGGLSLAGMFGGFALKSEIYTHADTVLEQHIKASLGIEEPSEPA